MKPLGHPALLAGLVASALFALPARADPAPAQTAEHLALEGQRALDAGDWATAADRFSRASSLGSIPLLIGLARAQVGLGRWLLARQSYERALQAGASPDLPDATRTALLEAHRELDLLVLRIPSLTLQLSGAPPSELLLDGASIPALALTHLPVDPGKHTLRARAAGGSAVTLSVTVDEGRTETVTLELSPGTPTPPAAAKAPSLPPSAPSAPSAPSPSAPLAPRPQSTLLPPAPPASPDDGSGQRTVSYVTFGLGGAGLLIGTISAVVAANQHAALQRLCVSDHCPVSALPQLDSYHTVGTVSTVSFLGGGMGVAAGAILFFTAPRGKARSTAGPTLGARLGPGTLGLGGSF